MLFVSADVLKCLAMLSMVSVSHSMALYPEASRHLTNLAFDQAGSTLFGNPRFDSFLTTNFGAAVALTPDGLYLAVGAPNHDADDASQGNGGLFFYDYVNSDWILSQTIIGYNGEGLGERFSMSDDGSRVAVRRRANNTDFVEVYHNGSRLGTQLSSCSAIGNTVSISPDGNRVAVSCERVNNNAGKVEIFEWNPDVLDWTLRGAPLRGEIVEGIVNTLFGFATCFDSSGNRLAVSAPLRNSASGIERTGVVRVFEYDSTIRSWIQLGQELSGTGFIGQFGASLDLDASGRTLLIGAPGTGSAGEVHIFELNEVNQWDAKGTTVLGEFAEDDFGRSVSLSADGNRLVASSSNHNEGRGHVRLLQYDGTDWVQLAEDIEGLAAGDGFGFGINCVSLSGDGTRVASGSIGADSASGFQTGSARVFDLVDQDVFPSSQPSLSPSIYSNVLAFVPTSAASEIPTITLDKFSWDLNRTGSVVAIFSEATDEQEIVLEYRISLRAAIVQIFEIDCVTQVSSSYVDASHATSIVSPSHGNLDVFLDIKQDAIVGSPIWSPGSTTREGFIDLCVRVDLVIDEDAEPPTSVNFHEQQLFLTIGLSQGFTVTAIDLDREDADQLNQDVQLDYGLEACQCNSTFHCINDTLVQGDDVHICVYSTDENIEISAIEELDLTQGGVGGLVVAAIDNGVEDVLTAVLQIGKLSVIRSQMRSDFFIVANPADVDVSGVASVIFVNETTPVRRVLRLGDLSTRSMQATSPKDNPFEVTVSLTTNMPAPDGGKVRTGVKMGPMFGGIVGGVIGCLVIVGLAIHHRKMKQGGTTVNVEVRPSDLSTEIWRIA